MPALDAPLPRSRTDDPTVLFLVDGSGRSVPLPAQPDSDESLHGHRAPCRTTWRTSPVWESATATPIGTWRSGMSGSTIPRKSGACVPGIPWIPPGTRSYRLEGIEVVRDTNSISDLIPGVTLNLQEASDKKVRLKVEPDREKSKEAIIELVGNYNRLMADINILSRNDERLVQEISYYTDEERKTATERAWVSCRAIPP
ncbi:MAG: flagellar filament capping protein FliD [Chromatiales bacterium]|nr:flagellar filament capping protein FliD [Chromatiales bacterium]